MQRTLSQRAAYVFLRIFTRLFGVALFRMRCHGRDNISADGGGLVCCNHQSFFDPVLVGLTFDRRLNYLARKSLFGNRLFGWLINFLDAIPIDRDGMGLEGIKETLKRLRRDELVLIFPEGTRTRDGNLSQLRPGFVALARRGKQPLIPVALDGAYDSWPRHALLPFPAPIHICVGESISADQIAALTDEELVAELEQRIAACFRIAREGARDERSSTETLEPSTKA